MRDLLTCSERKSLQEYCTYSTACAVRTVQYLVGGERMGKNIKKDGSSADLLREEELLSVLVLPVL